MSFHSASEASTVLTTPRTWRWVRSTRKYTSTIERIVVGKKIGISCCYFSQAEPTHFLKKENYLSFSSAEAESV